MERKIVQTGDGSTTIQIVDWDEQYHSLHGAINEARHVFLEMGLNYFVNTNPAVDRVHILEIGFGTGLNALLTAIHASDLKIKVVYEGVEAYPVATEEVEQLNYKSLVKKPDFDTFFDEMHACNWEEKYELSPEFSLKKRKQTFETINDQDIHDLIYFDAFGARVQPELWGVPIFKRMYSALKVGGVLVTYAAKGSVRRAMQEVGFTVERLPGPPGKREMLRGTVSNDQ